MNITASRPAENTAPLSVGIKPNWNVRDIDITTVEGTSRKLHLMDGSTSEITLLPVTLLSPVYPSTIYPGAITARASSSESG
jgi:hypothetical protein